MITILTKHNKAHHSQSNKGVRISLCSKNRISVNFNRDITKFLPDYMNIGYEDNKLYFLTAEYDEGYKVSKKEGLGRLCFTPEKKHLNIMKKFIGNHQIQSGYGHTFITVHEEGTK